MSSTYTWTGLSDINTRAEKTGAIPDTRSTMISTSGFHAKQTSISRQPRLHADGKIVMHDIIGAGTAKTASGDVEVFFAKNPDSDCSFKTVAGDIHAVFLENLSADFLLKARYGDAYSDFPVILMPVQSSATEERKNGKYVYRSNASVGIRIGAGGPEIKMDTLAGDILINKK